MLGAGIATGVKLHLAVCPAGDGGPHAGVFVGVGIVFAGAYTWLLDRYVVTRHLDRPRPQMVLVALPRAVALPNGARQTHRQVHLRHPATGEPLLVRPRSSLLCLPVPAWPYLFASTGIVVMLGCALALLLR